jgi:hypothetical protein
MTSPRPWLGLIALLFAGLAFSAATASADPQHHSQRLVVRGDATITDTPADGGLRLDLKDGRFRGAPVGSGDYDGSIQLRVAETFPNGEGGVCAPIDGQITLGAGTPNRLILAVSGDSCQDGAGDPTTTSFTGLARFSVKYGTGSYRGARGSGTAAFAEDAADHDRMTLIGHIAR